MINDELHRHRVGQRSRLQRIAIAQLQPAGPVGEGAAVTAYGIGGGASGDERCGGGTGLGIEVIDGQQAAVAER